MASRREATIKICVKKRIAKPSIPQGRRPRYPAHKNTAKGKGEGGGDFVVGGWPGLQVHTQLTQSYELDSCRCVWLPTGLVIF